MAYLILVRHGKSEWNNLGLWTGLTDVELAPEGFVEARKAGEAIKDIEIHCAHISMLKRTHQTFNEIKKSFNHDVASKAHEALNERDYGIHTGKNKWQVKEEIGEVAFQQIRRGWNVPIQGGETLQNVHDRVVPYYETNIKPELASGKNVIVVAHGNTLRALVKNIENISDVGIGDVEIGTGEVYCYQIDPLGAILSKEIRTS